MPKYKKKPIIEAVKWDKTVETFKRITDLYDENKDWQECIKNVDENSPFDFNEKTNSLAIHTLEGIMMADKGDYIIKGVNNEFYPCKPDVFHKTYEKTNDTIKVKLVTHHQDWDKECDCDYISVDVVKDAKIIAHFGDAYHDSGLDKARGFIKGLKYAFDEEVVVEKISVADNKF